MYIHSAGSIQWNSINATAYVQRSAIEYLPVHADTCVQSRVFVIFDLLREQTSQLKAVRYGLCEWMIRSWKVGLHELTRYSAEELPPWMDWNISYESEFTLKM